jgi:hypothetical protein
MASLLLYDTISICAPLHRKASLLEVGGFDELLKDSQEWDLHLRLAAGGYTFKYLKCPVFTYNIGREYNSISNTRAIREDHFIYELEKLTYIINKVIKAMRSNARSAAAFRFWSLGRKALINKKIDIANSCFDNAKTISPDNYKRYWTKKYAISVATIGITKTEYLNKIVDKFRSK